MSTSDGGAPQHSGALRFDEQPVIRWIPSVLIQCAPLDIEPVLRWGEDGGKGMYSYLPKSGMKKMAAEGEDERASNVQSSFVSRWC